MGYDYSGSGTSAWTNVTGGDFSFAYADLTYAGTVAVTEAIGDEPAPKRGRESALEWLDRRVDEVRVAL